MHIAFILQKVNVGNYHLWYTGIVHKNIVQYRGPILDGKIDRYVSKLHCSIPISTIKLAVTRSVARKCELYLTQCVTTKIHIQF